MARKSSKGLFFPELVEKLGRSWTVEEVEIRNAAVNTEEAKARVPRAHTPAQQLARLHELGHVKYSPNGTTNKSQGWMASIGRVMETVGEGADFDACMKLSKMLEENRIDWLLWSKHEIDLRPAREVLDWAQMPDPDTLLDAAGIVLQLAWTVWASRGLGKGIPNEPPKRETDPATGEYFDKAWKLIVDTNRELAHAIIQGCLKMYTRPTHAGREMVAAELAEFFKKEPKQEEQPPVKPEEKQAQEAAEQEERQQEQEQEDQETGAAAEISVHDQVEYHDHTTSIRRSNVRIVRRSVPVGVGVNLKYAHRYMLDKQVFAERRLTEGGIMIDGSSSMHWADDDMRILIETLPAVTVGIYSGAEGMYRGKEIIGRICTLAKQGRFAKFTGRDPGTVGKNAVDWEALKLLAKWPGPRLWLSDGLVNSPIYYGRCKHPHHHTRGLYAAHAKYHEMCTAWMKAHGILRVPDADTMHKLLKRQRVTLYRSTRPAYGLEDRGGWFRPEAWPDDIRPEPVSFQL
jgi:hypothetical protein